MITSLSLIVGMIGLIAASFIFLLALASIFQGDSPGIYILAVIFCLTLACFVLTIGLAP
jgi:hypothetical protein